MWNPFKKKFRVPFNNCANVIFDAMKQDNDRLPNVYWWLEKKYGIKRKYCWKTHQNYLIFDSEEDYTWFLLRWL